MAILYYIPVEHWQNTANQYG